MNKSAAGFCKRLHESLTEQCGTERADEICGKGVSSSASAELKGRWAAEAMGKVGASLDEAAQAMALAGCACGPGQAQLDAFRRTYLSCKSLEEYAQKRNSETGGGAHFEARDGMLYVSYPQCYCAMVKHAANPIPKTWCLCSCEYTRRACAYALDRPVEVKLLKSVIGGDEECLFEVKIL